MGVGIVLTMREPVTVRELRQFLSFVDDETNIDEDLRGGADVDEAVTLLAFDAPGTPRRPAPAQVATAPEPAEA